MKRYPGRYLLIILSLNIAFMFFNLSVREVALIPNLKLRLGVLSVFVQFCVFVFVWAILSCMVPLHLTCLHCLQHSFFEHLFNLYSIDRSP